MAPERLSMEIFRHLGRVTSGPFRTRREISFRQDSRNQLLAAHMAQHRRNVARDACDGGFWAFAKHDMGAVLNPDV